ncbi:MAG: CSLREA domain-containing protein [Gammaproteobacteria bacterium]|nr:CSLREA domain-containing protein [Gammaproteobacteria bacterium]
MNNRRVLILVVLIIPLLITAVIISIRHPPLTQASPNATITVNTVADENDGCGINNCSLREAIVAANSGDTIEFSVGGTIDIFGNGQLTIDKDLTISGTMPITVSGGNASRVFNITSGNVTFDSLTIANGNDQSTDCGFSCGGGIAIQNSGIVVTITNSTLINNVADRGGGIYSNSRS